MVRNFVISNKKIILVYWIILFLSFSVSVKLKRLKMFSRPVIHVVRCIGQRYYSIKPLPPLPPSYISNETADFSDKTPTSSTPIFSQALMSFFHNPIHVGKHFQILDMTFGAGGHTSYILGKFVAVFSWNRQVKKNCVCSRRLRIVIFLPVDQFALQGVIGSITVYANDCDPMAHDLAMKMRIERTYENTKLVPIKSKFKDLYEAMLSEGVEEESLSGIIIGKN